MTGRRGTPTAVPAPVWRDCPTCWAQGRILEPVEGAGFLVHVCGTCLGVGQLGPPGPPEEVRREA